MIVNRILESLKDSPYPESILLSTILLLSIFFICIKLPLFKDSKKLSWLISLITSIILSVTSIPFMYHYITNYPNFEWLEKETYLSKALTSYFLTALSLDLILGVIYYLPFVHILTGWIHHLSYIALILTVIQKKMTTPFCLMYVMELPTFILSLGSIFKKYRSDVLFGATFFTSRICYHIFMIVSFYWYTKNSFAVFILSSILPLHLFWFRGFILQQKRIHNKNRLLNNAPPRIVNYTK